MNEGRGGRNLVMLGVGAVAIAVISTGISLVVYHQSGDIYLDRSRPGFLPDEQEIEEDAEGAGDYKFADGGEVTKEVLKEYLEKLDEATERMREMDEPFAASALSDETLGIPAKAGKK